MSAPLPPGAAARVVVIDDEAEVGEIIAATAESMGLACTALTSAKRLDEALEPEVIAVLIDLLMPGMDGIELVRHLAAERCRAPVVLMSGQDRSVLQTAEHLARTLGLRTAGPLRKPFRIADVEQLLGSLRATAWPPMRRAGTAEAVTEDELRDAVEHDAFVVHYQPQVDLASGRVAGVEALARLQHPRRGLLAPNLFIPLAERTGLIGPLTNIVARRALREFGRVPALSRATLSINLSACSLNDLSLPDRLELDAQQSGVPLSRLVMEITESGLIQEFGKALDIFARLRLRGVGLSIDDFGTGYASMAQLRRIPLTELKVDGLFVRDMLEDDSARAVVEETIGLGHRLNLSVVAEGIESGDQARALRACGCELGQGYAFARPMAMPDLVPWLTGRDDAPPC